MGPVGEQALPADEDAAALDDAAHAFALHFGEVLGRGQRAEFGLGGLGDCLGDGMFGGVLESTGVAQQRRAVRIGGGDDLDEGHLAGGHGAGLVEHDGVDLCGSTPAPRAP